MALLSSKQLTEFQACAKELVRTLHNKRLEKEDDLMVNPRASTVSDYFVGYPFVTIWNPKGVTYPETYDVLSEIESWCKTECQGQYTHRILQVFSKNDWTINDIAGEEHCFWAFTNEQDMLMFSLRW